MSKKRASPDSSNDEQTNEGSDSIFQQDGNTKRASLDPSSDTTLQDLPMETIEYILIKAVTMEVNDMKLAKSVWKEKSDLVISRLRTVCSQWSHILTTNFFRNELQRSFDAMKMVRIEMLHQYPIVVPPNTSWINQVISTMDYVFMIGQVDERNPYSLYYTCNVYDHNNMAEVKDVIPLPGYDTPRMVACNESNCVHVICRESWFRGAFLMLRIAEDDEHRFTASSLVTEMGMMPGHTLLQTANGSLIFSKTSSCAHLTVIGIYDASGSLQHEIKFSSYISNLYRIIPRSNGNLVLVSANDNLESKLTEIDMDGNVLRQYQTSIIEAYSSVCDGDMYGRILIVENLGRIELFDSEFNLLEFVGPQQDECKLGRCGRLHYNRERNEFCIYSFKLLVDESKEGVLTTYRLQ